MLNEYDVDGIKTMNLLVLRHKILIGDDQIKIGGVM